MKDEYRKLFTRDDPIPPRVVAAKYRAYDDFFSCRNCGYALSAQVPGENYCPNCGQRIKHYKYAGKNGWNEKAAEEDWNRMLQEKTAETKMREADENGI